jgi:hypothetical protein
VFIKPDFPDKQPVSQARLCLRSGGALTLRLPLHDVRRYMGYRGIVLALQVVADHVAGNVSRRCVIVDLQVAADIVVIDRRSSSRAMPPFGKNFQIQSISAGQPQGAVCGSTIKGNLVVQDDASPVEIGTNNANACAALCQNCFGPGPAGCCGSCCRGGTPASSAAL